MKNTIMVDGEVLMTFKTKTVAEATKQVIRMYEMLTKKLFYARKFEFDTRTIYSLTDTKEEDDNRIFGILLCEEETENDTATANN